MIRVLFKEKTDNSCIQMNIVSASILNYYVIPVTVFSRLSAGGLNRRRVNKNDYIMNFQHISSSLECNSIENGNFGMYNVGENHSNVHEYNFLGFSKKIQDKFGPRKH